MTQTPTVEVVNAHEVVNTRRLRVRHGTHYQYSNPVERSAHRLHLCPSNDWKQRVVDYKLTITPAVQVIEFEDVFGNWSARFEVNEPYTQLSIVAESVVEQFDVDPFGFTKLPTRPRFPVSWMPWERTMLGPYLTPMELPETQLLEILDYAQSFVARNNGDLMETLFDINLTLFREYKYVPGTTSLETTPYEVFVTKQGVCQDLANLFICMARLLNVPARYVCGYVYTGNTGEARAQSDASHAWVQLFIPNIGWKGFDPTNGVLPNTDHVRVAVGRHYRDTAPTAGTLYSVATEQMTLDVEVVDLDAAPPAPAPEQPAPAPVAVN